MSDEMTTDELENEMNAEAAAGEQTPGGASVSSDEGGAAANEPAANTDPRQNDGIPNKPAAVAAVVNDVDIPEALRAQFGGATKLSEVHARAQAAQTHEQNYLKIARYAQRLEDEKASWQQQQQRQGPGAGGQGPETAGPKCKYPGFNSDAEFQAAYQADPFAAIHQTVEARLLANPKFAERLVDPRVQQGMQPLMQTEQQRQEQAFNQHLTGQFQALEKADRRFSAPSQQNPNGGELFKAADTFFTENEKYLRQRAMEQPGFNPFEFTANYVIGEVSKLQLKAANTKLDGMRRIAGTASPASGAGVAPKTSGRGTAFDDAAEVEAESPELAAQMTPQERLRFTQMLDRAN